MGAVALEVNDAGLLMLREGRPRPQESPCLALFEDGAVLTGQLAAARAHVRPRAVHDAYFDPLDLEPLGRPFPAGTRHADLAHAHLAALADGLTPGDEVFLAVPGFWSAPSLGLLLGVAGAAGLRPAGLVDAAVAATSLVSGGHPCLHVDLTWHRSVVTVLRGGAEGERDGVGSAEGTGLRAFEERLAREIAGTFVAESRFDPLHSGSSEQALRAALPGWLRELRRAEACAASLSAAGREHRATLSREALAGATADLQRAVAEQAKALAPAGNARLVVSARASGIPGLVARLAEATRLDPVELPYDGTVVATLHHRDRLRHPGPALPFVTRLPPMGPKLAAPAVRSGARPTHLLHAGVAHVLGPADLNIGTAPPPGARGLALRREGVLPHHASIVTEGGELWLLPQAPGLTFVNGEPVEGRTALRAGDRLRLGDPGVELLLVAIADGEA